MIKKLSFDEIDMIIDIEKEAFREAWTKESYQKLYKDYDMGIYAFFLEEEIIAYAVLLDMADVYELVRIAVKKKFRGKKYGNILLKEVQNQLDKKIFLEVRENNLAAIKLYGNTGFQTINIRKKYYRDTGENALIMIYDK